MTRIYFKSNYKWNMYLYCKEADKIHLWTILLLTSTGTCKRINWIKCLYWKTKVNPYARMPLTDFEVTEKWKGKAWEMVTYEKKKIKPKPTYSEILPGLVTRCCILQQSGPLQYPHKEERAWWVSHIVKVKLPLTEGLSTAVATCRPVVKM